MASSKNMLHRIFRLDAAAHGGQSKAVPQNGLQLQVINLGLSRTGTTSMHFALEKLGFAPGHQGVDFYRYPAHNKACRDFFDDLNAGCMSQDAITARLRQLLSGYQSTNDGPLNHLVRELYAAFPNAKYILCLRRGGQDAWWRSFDAALGLHFRTDWSRIMFRFLIWPVGFIRRQDDLVQKGKNKVERDLGIPYGPDVYAKHNEMVKRVIPEEKLLVFYVDQGWAPLCDFLDVDIPQESFPSVNELDSMKKIYFGMQAFGALMWMLYIGGFVVVMYLAFYIP